MQQLNDCRKILLYNYSSQHLLSLALHQPGSVHIFVLLADSRLPTAFFLQGKRYGMVKIVSVAEMRAIEQEADAAGLSYTQMMNNAGRALADRVLTLLAGRPAARIAVLVGPGNNGGDALVGGRLIAAESDHQVSFYLSKPRDDSDPNFAAVRQAELFVADASNDQRHRVLKNLIASSDVIIDGLLGIGLRLPVEGAMEKFMRAVRESLNAARRETPHGTYQTPDDPAPFSGIGPYVIAVDCPSGLDCDTGALDAAAIPANETITFAAVKRGLVTFPGAAAVGTLHVADIGLPESLPSRDAVTLDMPTGAEVRARLPALPPDANKGTFGKAMIVAGSLNYTGAAALAAGAAYRVGSGLVTVGAPQPIIPILAAHLPEATWLLLPHDLGVLAEGAAAVLREELAGYSALLLGPGWGREDATRDFLCALLMPEDRQQAARHIGFAPLTVSVQGASRSAPPVLPPLVIDADGLNLLSGIDDWPALLPAGTILTPHPGEMSRLTGLDRDQVQADRIGIATEKARAWNCVVVLKGAHTVIAAPDGRAAVLPFVEPALATAGTGDVLAGAIVGLLGQGLPPFDAALVAGYVHGLAGKYAARRHKNARSVTAGDVLAALPEALSTVESAI